jgi:uncharacterized Rossmann fold enzyme
MEYKDWKPIYKKIINDFNFSLANDINSAKILNNLLKDKDNLISINKLNSLINNKEIIIFGAGRSLEVAIKKNRKKMTNKLIISADGATSALIENNILPDIIVTDLDGKVSDQIKANDKGSILVIHAHGDNIDKIKKIIPKFKGLITGTTQTNPESYGRIHNFGGFTDGDRAVFLSVHFNAKKIYLAGFDYDGKIGVYSFPDFKDKKLKLKKLKWCKFLISSLKTQKNIYYI